MGEGGKSGTRRHRTSSGSHLVVNDVNKRGYVLLLSMRGDSPIIYLDCTTHVWGRRSLLWPLAYVRRAGLLVWGWKLTRDVAGEIVHDLTLN